MAQRSIQGSEALARKIRNRRLDLELTIEEAASLAGVGTKTWCRYEAGESIRHDKCKGICKALNWYNIPDQDTDENGIYIKDYKEMEAWSTYLEDVYGTYAAFSFAFGSDVLLDFIHEDITELSTMPAGSHVGQVHTSMLKEFLPRQFLMKYDYEFLYQMECTLVRMRARAANGASMIAHSVMEELIFYLCNEEAESYITLSDTEVKLAENVAENYSSEWIYDMFDDMDLITFLYSDRVLDEDDMYHFAHWNELQFYMEA